MSPYKLIQLSAEAGKIILESGGETYRVEETIVRICQAYDTYDVESFVTPTGIIISITDKSDKIISLTKRITTRSVNLEKVKRVNDLSRSLCQNPISEKELEKQLDSIKNTPTYNGLIFYFFSALAVSAFTLLFGGNFKDGFVSFFIGLIIQKSSQQLSKIKVNGFFINILGGMIAAFLAIISVKLNLGSNIDKIIIGDIMMLVPGLAITNAIRDTIAGDLVSGISRAVEAFLVAIALAIGSGLILRFWLKLI